MSVSVSESTIVIERFALETVNVYITFSPSDSVIVIVFPETV